MKAPISRLKQGVAAVLAAALILLSPGLGCYEAFAEVVASPISGTAPVGTAPAKMGSASVLGQSTLSDNARSLSLAPAALSQLPVSNPTVVDHAQPVLLAAPVESQIPSAVPVLARSAALLAAPASEKPQEPAASPLASLQTSQDQVSAVLSRQVSNEDATTAAAMPFEGDIRTGAIEAEASPLEVPVAAAPAASKRTTSGLRRAGINLAGGAATGIAFIGIQHAFTSAAVQVPSWTAVLDLVGTAGYYIGNGLAFVFAVPQMLKTFEDGHHGATPIKRALLGMSASLALGLISAPLAGQLFWGVQNIFGALTLVAPLLIGKVLAHEGVTLSGARAVAATAAASAALLAVSFGLYAAAAAVLPALLPALLGKAGVSALTLAIQVATGAAFLFLFAPDVSAIFKRKAPTGFTPFFSLLFSAASAGFIAWTLQKAIEAPAGSPQRLQFIIYAAQNILYAAVAWMSYVYSRKHEQKAKAGKLSA
ncbi:MAG: hypothetical protein NTY77_09210 [Elusimicrobia bacterium]|nr:hypothetical protein [Elusimicrobiota bacterium]